ncbi:MAG: hypothetical protein ACQEWE_11660 [Bacillota bacterium]
MEEEKIAYEEDYLAKFKQRKLQENTTIDPMTKKALERALDIRKFEIDLYWKRATYFWGFLIVIFAGYFAIWGAKTEAISYKEKLIALLLISCLGFIFSFCWFLVNKGSKYWQNNWERHVDMLEDEVIGPLYKTVLVEEMANEEGEQKGNRLKNYIVSSEEYSVSKVNQILSFFLLIIWGVIGIVNMLKVLNDYIVNDLGYLFISNEKILNFPLYEIMIVVITFYFFLFLKREGKSSHKTGTKKDTHFIVRDKALPRNYKKP